MRRVCITGSCGMIGSWLTQAFLDQGDYVIGIDDYSGSSADNLPTGQRAFDHFKFYQEDLINYSRVEDIFHAHKPEIVYHLASCAREGASEFQPFKITRTNVYISSVVLELGIKYGMKRFVFTSCLDEESRLFANGELKRFNEITIGDKVLSINPDSKIIEDDEVEDIFVYDHAGEMCFFGGSRASILVTSNHRMFYEKSFNRNPHLAFEKANRSINRALLKLPSGEWKGEVFEGDSIELPTHKDVIKNISSMEAGDFFYLSGLFIADGVANKAVNIIPNVTGLNREDYLAIGRDSFGRFKKLGRVGNQEYSVNHSYAIRFCVPRKDKARGQLEFLLAKYGIKWYELEDGNQISFSCKSLHDIWKTCGNNAHEKHIPKWMLKYDKKYLERLFEGLIDGDGYKGKNGDSMAFTTVSWRLVQNIVELTTKIGRTANFKFHLPPQLPKIKGREIKSGGAYHVSLGKTARTLYKKNFSKITNYAGKVWCIKTRNGNFLMERDGKVVFTGNSMSVYGKGRLPFDEKQPAKPVDPYGVSKWATEQILWQLADTHKFEAVVLRPHNVVGERQNMQDKFRNVAAIFINSIMRKEPLYLFGNNHMRAFSYILDSLPCFMRAATNQAVIGKTINVGGKEFITIKELAEEIIKNMPEYPRPEIIQLPPRPHEVAEAYCTTALSEELLGYQEEYGWKEGIRRMVEWCKIQGPREWRYDTLPLISEATPLPWIKK